MSSTPLGARRARRIDERQQVARLDRAPGRLEVEAVLRPRLEVVEGQPAVLPLAIDNDHVLEAAGPLGRPPDRVEEGALGHDDPAAGVLGNVLDLLGRVGVVHRERRGPEVHGGGIDPVELGAVGQHDRHRVAAGETEPGQAGGEALDLVGVLRPRHRQLVALGPDGDPVAVVGSRRLERAADRGLVECPVAGPLALAGCCFDRCLLPRAPRPSEGRPRGGTIAP
ncbi:MAG TPA: hypothetical protein VK387_07435 [Thermoleophilaceae bacterium]|nr:hypothetical protein [Thermoleophilaceae bacterium]